MCAMISLMKTYQRARDTEFNGDEIGFYKLYFLRFSSKCFFPAIAVDSRDLTSIVHCRSVQACPRPARCDEGKCFCAENELKARQFL